MREIRTFELEQGEPAQQWNLTQPANLQVNAGEVWLTIAGELDDHWLRAGDAWRLCAGVRVWVSAGEHGASFQLALGGAAPGGRTVAARDEAWLSSMQRRITAMRRRWSLGVV